MRNLERWNLIGVIAVAILCLSQWHRNRELNRELNLQIRRNHELTTQLDDRERDVELARTESNGFKDRLALTELNETKLKEELGQSFTTLRRLELERSQLRMAISNWQEAVVIRDRRLSESDQAQRKLTDSLKEGTARYNQLATNYNTLILQSKSPATTNVVNPAKIQ